MTKTEEEVKEQPAKTTAIVEISLKDMALQEIGKVGAGIAALKEKWEGKPFDVTTTAGMEFAKAARLDIRNTRYPIPHIVKAKKQELKKIGEEIEAEGDRITGILLEMESPFDEGIKAEEERKRLIKEEKARIEKERVDGIRARIDKLKALPVVALGAENAADLELFIGKVEAAPIGVEFQEFKEEAEAAKAEAVGKLKDMLTLKQQQEEEAARLEDERKENERKAELQGRVDAIKRIAIDAASVQDIEELERLKASVGATDLTDMQEYEDAATEAIAQTVAAISSLIEQKEEALRLQEERQQIERDRQAVEAENLRKSKIQTLIGEIRNFPLDLMELDSVAMRRQTEQFKLGGSLLNDAGREVYAEFTEEAELVRLKALGQVNVMIAAAEKNEESDRKERERQEKDAAEQAEREAAALATEPVSIGVDLASGSDVTVEVEMITITKSKYDELCRDQAILGALRAAGVDNWDGWDFAMESLEVAA